MALRLVCSTLCGFILGAGCTHPKVYHSLPHHLRWLSDRMVPNKIVDAPLPARRHLLLSYEVPQTESAYPYIYSKSFIYDDAMAAIAFCTAAEWDKAQQLLLSLSRLIRDNGSFWFNYSTNTDWPSEKDQESTLVRTGALAWTGYAYCFFLENHPSLKPEDRAYAQCITAAKNIAVYIQNTLVSNSTDPLYGLVRGGEGEINLAVSESSEVTEVWKPGPVTWASAEHNIDAHLFLSHLAALTGDITYKRTAETISQACMATLYSSEHGQFFRGIKGPGNIDSVLALDCASWASLFFQSIGEKQKAKTCLETAKRLYANSYHGLNGYRPYAGILVYEKPEINTHFFPDKPTQKWETLPFIWLEGSYGVFMAQLAAGNRAAVCRELENWSRVFDTDTLGGLPYSAADTPLPYQFTTWKSVASTAWHIILINMLYGPEMKQPFFSAAHDR
ncbi:MAG: hypothetical protein A2268_12735 [Candidatus Raymondbacteria bacterium RifOxyA12_full_50_37]|uniref:Alpha-L-rhamnosidase six-hairpin glycosidase domain-containing protein n=1 Tax=Candidatus Raymondbacteria bacterium RIFOXYD12_FULL_49_13 TaxID=1817890 RepID=A0A1F7FJ76_UNCRA|nr:MAG: hypothetical protein A2268_12735 [Candidatus Raymondbacteria bacterium RifOxyA12_full_50_37]OGJ90797.1 MAG: hypothetical protein A2248_02255 [Candidatus Raymondbacteria bacterium RIFOXYA2_FULL_49_16]OGJ96330.1 MAG: hypothetical protein A2350_03735 [Candidatus Raymondbacteria bacterium RifOxyB12_full_50_8]OGJ97364.1 MAG: hypothetical protein A2453_03535 [Candidatus Raymondbacteria bacterium RIFOXYC2_FULL_50_21]OGK06526.1 MAG: hypothetical protein A2519_04335 [Candidatus Raymondbacteria b